ncbi:hypothetical protein EYF80_068331 [Liparis tanakae]|uniref:Secreted protein n=1 Tax=Liparis tanakae TaxID=230148 RepID=A0A4Z2DYQ9_9TELE|nr:hypothetical protein EYF80_068331 [Liparis tanakae]
MRCSVFVLQLRSLTSSVTVRTSWWSTTFSCIAAARSNRPATPEITERRVALPWTTALNLDGPVAIATTATLDDIKAQEILS